MNKRVMTLLTGALVLSSLVEASQLRDNLSPSEIDFYTIQSIEINQLPQDSSPLMNVLSSRKVRLKQASQAERGIVDDLTSGKLNKKLEVVDETLDTVDSIVDKVINIGSKVWKVVEKGRPVLDVAASVATATPPQATSWDDLEYSRLYTSRPIEIIYRNLYGIEVVRFVYEFSFLHSGSYNGAGKYIGYARIIPKEVRVLYGFNLDAKATTEAVYNKGSKQNPIAAMKLILSWKTNTIVNSLEGSHTFEIDGLGNISAR